MTSTLEQAYEHVVDVTEAAPLQGALGKSVMRKIGQVEKYNPYIQTDEARKTLQTFGIGVHPRPVEEHSHPACKAIENYMLVQAGQHLDEEATCCFMKAKKLELLFRGRPVPNVQLLNEYITPKDLSRYGQDVITNVLMHIDTETGFVHDAMHYYNPDILGHIFDENPKLQKLVYTVVIPPEVQARDRSLYPELYTIHYPVECPNRFEFWPDGHSAGLYQQDVKCAEWLYLGRVVGTRSIVTVDKLESYGAHHLFIAVRGKKRIDPVRSYPCKDLVEMPKLWVTDATDSRMGVSRGLLMRLYEYGRSLKQVEERDLVAKLRQILSTRDLANMDIMTLEWLVQVVLMMLQMQKVPKAKLLAGTTALERWTERAKSSLYEWCQAFVGLTTSSQVFRQAAGLRPYNFDGPTTIRGVISTFVRFNIGKKRVRVSKTGKRKAYAVNVHRLAQEMPEIEEEFEHEKLIQSIGKEVGVAGRDIDQLMSEPTLEESSPSIEGDEGPVHVGELALQALEEDHECTPSEYSKVGTENPDVEQSNEEPCAVGSETEDPTEREPSPDTQQRQVQLTQKPNPTASPSREVAKHPNPERAGHGTAQSETVNWIPSAYSDEALSIINKYGVRIKKREVDGNGELIDPLWVQEINPELRKDEQAKGSPVAKRIVESLNQVGRHVYEHSANPVRAAAYASDLQYGSVGTLRTDPKFGPRLEGLKKRCQRTTEKTLVAVLLGAGGAGKSHQLQQVLHKAGGSLEDITVIAPTRVLRDEWVNTFPGARPDSILTYERAFNKPLGNVVILDDFGKLPHGYVDVLITHKTGIELIVLTGDFRQSVYHEQNQEAAIANLPAEMDVFAQYADYYLNLTRRCPRIVSKALGIFPANDEIGKVSKVDHMPNAVPVLVPSVKQRDALVTTGKEVYTYAGSQGITRQRITVLLTSDTRWCDERTMYTAFSRAKQVIYLTEDTLGDSQFQSKLEATPYLKTLLNLVREPELMENSPPASVVREMTPRTHLPVETDKALGDDLVEKLGPTEDRELFTQEYGRTEVYKSETGEQNRMQHHQAKDDALVSISYKKRLRHQTIGANQKEFKNTRKAGIILFESFRKAYDLPVEPRKFDQKLWDQCEQEVEGRYLQKTEAQIKQGEERQDPDFDENFIKLFLKSQRIKKDEKYGLEQAKAGQPITSFKQQTVMRTGVLARYVRRVLQQLQPDNVYIHTEQSDLDFHKWVRDHWDFTQKSYESDYTMYDQSQGGECLNFELMLCRYAGVPAAEMQFYSALKMRSEVYSGILKIMRLSGEGPTFDFNTFCNIAYHHTKYVIPKGTPQCFAGDDMAQCGVPVERSNWSKIQSMFQLVAKPIVSEYPGFIGFRLTPFGVVRSPLKLYRSLKLAEELGNINETLEAYSRDIYYMYCLGEGAMDGNIFTEDEITAHWLALRMIHRLNYKPIRPEGADGILPTPANEDEEGPNDWLTNARYRLQGKSSTRRRNALRYRKNRA